MARVLLEKNISPMPLIDDPEDMANMRANSFVYKPPVLKWSTKPFFNFLILALRYMSNIFCSSSIILLFQLAHSPKQ